MGLARFASAFEGASKPRVKGNVRVTHCVVSVIQTQAAHKANFLARQRREKFLHRQDVLRDLRSGVERRADDLVRLDGLLLVKRESDCREACR